MVNKVTAFFNLQKGHLMNTQCTPEPMRDSSLNSQKVQADFDGGTLTSDAGALRLRDDPNEPPEDRDPGPIQRPSGRLPPGLGLSPPRRLPNRLRPADGPSEPFLGLRVIP